MSGSFSDSFFATPTTTDEIINIVSSLKSSNSEGVDGINVNVIKASIDLLASLLSQMYNISFSTAIVPDKLKISKVIPMFKSEDSINFTNYRPISILPCFSKILESAMHRRLMDYLTKQGELSDLRHTSLWLWHLIIVNLCFVYLFINKKYYIIIILQL